MDVPTAERVSYAVARAGQLWAVGCTALFAYHRAWVLVVMVVGAAAFFEYSVQREIDTHKLGEQT